MVKIYTRSGDDGGTTLYRGGRVSKASLRVGACGAVDEVNSVLGWVRSFSPPDPLNSQIHHIQQLLFTIGADLATPEEAVKPGDQVLRLPVGSETFLEEQIDRWTEVIPSLSQFILPGGTPLGAALHLARTICRRAEREVVALAVSEPINTAIVVFLNRLSDYLFTAARWVNYQMGAPEEIWKAK